MRILEKYLRPLLMADGGGGDSGSDSGSGGAASSPPPSSDGGGTSSGGSGSVSSSPPASGGLRDDTSVEAPDIDFSSIFGSDAGDSGDVVPPPTPVPPKPAEPKPHEGAEPPKPVEAPPAPGPKDGSVASAPTDATSSPQPQAQPQAAGSLDPFDPSAIASVLQANEAMAIQHVADTMFKLSAEEIEALENDTVNAIPKLLAKGMVRGQLNMLNQLSRLIPAMISRHGEVTKRHSANESKFYARWPDLKPETHGAMVLKYGAVYRQMHPDAPLETMIEDLGPMVMMAAKVVPSNGVPPKASGRSPRAPQPSPFTPAGAVAGGASPQTAQELNEFESMFLSPDD